MGLNAAGGGQWGAKSGQGGGGGEKRRRRNSNRYHRFTFFKFSYFIDILKGGSRQLEGDREGRYITK